MGKSEAGASLVIELTPASQSVSAVSSLLREVQAALREAARTVPDTARMFEGDQSPALTVRFTGAASGVSMQFAFVDAATRAPLARVSDAVATRFMRALEDVLKQRPRRTLWGQQATVALRKSRDGSRDPVAERAAVVLAELGRAHAASVAAVGRRIQLQGDTAEIL